MAAVKFNENFDMDDDFLIFKERLEMFFTLNNINEDKTKTMYLLASMSVTVYKLLRNLVAPKIPQDHEYDEVAKLMQEQFTIKTNFFRERRKFYSVNQLDGERINEYFNKLKGVSVNCNFGNNLQSILLDRFVCGLTKGKVFDKMCEQKSDITLKECLSIALSMEDATIEADNVHQVIRRNLNRKSCEVCGYNNHNANTCKYRKYKCNICGEVGHLRKVCRKGGTNRKRNAVVGQIEKAVDMEAEDDSKITEDGEEVLNLWMIEEQLDTGKLTQFCHETNFNLDINDIDLYNSSIFSVILSIEGKDVCLEVDTGSAISALPKDLYQRCFNHLVLKQYKRKLSSYDGKEIVTAGMMEANIVYRGRKIRGGFVIIDNGSRPLLGRDIFRKLDFKITVNNVVESAVYKGGVPKMLEDMANRISQGLGCYIGKEIKLELIDGASAVFVKPRPVPFAYKSKLESELNRLETLGIITKIDVNDWGTPLVTVVKKNGELRICADYSVTINPLLQDVNYPIPRIDDVFAALQGGKTFSTLDLSQAYHQLKVDKETGKMLAWSTEKGIFRVNRLPYGCKPNTFIFQNIMDTVLTGCKGAIAFIDDVIVTGKTHDEHIENLKSVLNKFTEVGFIINKNKCQFFKDKVQYLGYVVDQFGLHKDKKKVEAIVKMSPPKTKKEVRAFCGLINYYSRFMADISIVLKPIYDLIGVEKIIWTKQCEDAFQLVKNMIASDTILMHYNPEMELVLATDACDSGIGAMLAQVCGAEGEKPIAFASRTLSKSESNYSMIHKEALAIYFGVKKFEQYLIGRKFMLKTDHKPLVSIFGKNKGIPLMSASRLLRWALYLSNFNFEIKHIKGKENLCADVLSRMPIPLKIDEDNEEDFTYLNFIQNELGKPLNLLDIAKATKAEKVLSQVVDEIKNGWVNEYKGGEESAYYSRKTELYVEENVIMWGHRIIIPKRFRKLLLDEIHASHQGIVKMKQTARSFFWWPNIDKEIENFVKQCRECGVYQAMPTKVEAVPWPEPKRVMERVHMDFCGPKYGMNYLVIVDVYSKWIDVQVMKEINANKTIEQLKKVFVVIGIPECIVTDNGPTFVSKEFEKFLEEIGTSHITSPIYHPQSNGQAENAVKIFKVALQKMYEGEKCKPSDITFLVQRFLYINRNSINTVTRKTPFEIMFNRRPFLRWNLLATVIPVNRKSEKENVKSFDRDEEVWVKLIRTNKWEKGYIKEILGCNTYMVMILGQQRKIHANHLRKYVGNHSRVDRYSKLEQGKCDNTITLKGILQNKASVVNSDIADPRVDIQQNRMPNDIPNSNPNKVGNNKLIQCAVALSQRNRKPPTKLNL